MAEKRKRRESLLRVAMPTSTRCGSARWRSGATGDAVHDLGRLCEKADDAAEIPGERRESNALRTHGSSLSIGGPHYLGPANGLRSPPSTFQAHVVNPDASRFSAERDSAGPARRGLDDHGRSLDSVGRRRVAPLVGRPARILRRSRFGPGRNSDK